jgi:hypothetical protein
MLVSHTDRKLSTHLSQHGGEILDSLKADAAGQTVSSRRCRTSLQFGGGMVENGQERVDLILTK